MNLRKLFGATLLAAVAVLLFAGGPAKATNLDNKIESSVRKSYVFKTYLKDDAIKVKSLDGKVTLSGTVSSESHKTMAEETANSLPGVTGVNNQLNVAGSPVNASSDAWIGERVKAMLLFHRSVSYMDTDVSVADGKVTLRGKANSKAQRDLTTEYARDVNGVKDVENLMVVPDPEPLVHKTRAQVLDDASITSQVRMVLRYRHGVDPYDTKVVTNKGVVTLTGTALNQAEIDLVTKRISDIRGVKEVDNKMTVEIAQSSTN